MSALSAGEALPWRHGAKIVTAKAVQTSYLVVMGARHATVKIVRGWQKSENEKTSQPNVYSSTQRDGPYRTAP
jgi:hypothetical protein